MNGNWDFLEKKCDIVDFHLGNQHSDLSRSVMIFVSNNNQMLVINTPEIKSKSS